MREPCKELAQLDEREGGGERCDQPEDGAHPMSDEEPLAEILAELRREALVGRDSRDDGHDHREDRCSASEDPSPPGRSRPDEEPEPEADRLEEPWRADGPCDATRVLPMECGP